MPVIRFLAVLLLFCLGSKLQGQLPLPERLPLPAYDSLGPAHLIAGAFYPVGFSENGKLAYVIEPADEACGCYFFEFRIQNLVTDKVLFRYAYRGDEGPEAGKYDSLPQLWAAHSALFREKLRQHGISPEKPTFLESLPDFRVAVDTQQRLVKDLSRDPFLDRATIRLEEKSTRASKVVAQLDYSRLYVFRLEPLGYLKSPFEDRTALLLARVSRGWEGLPLVLDFEVVGAHLRARFP